MNVLVITRLFPNENNSYNGIFVKDICDNLIKNHNININVISPIPKSNFILAAVNKKYKDYYNHSKMKKENNYIVYYPRYNKYIPKLNISSEAYFYAKSVLRKIRKYKMKVDVIYSHWLYPDAAAIKIIADKLDVPYIIHSHEDNLMLHLKNKALKSKIVDAINNSKVTYCVSNDAKSKLLHTFNVNKNNIKVVYNGVDTKLFHYEKDENLKKQLNIKEDDKVVTCVAALDRKKGQYNLIEAAYLLKQQGINNMKFIFVGNGPEYDKYKKAIESYDLTDEILMVGFKNKKEITQLLNISDLFVLPSNFESFGIVTIEALACGVPVVASNVGGIPEIINSDELGVLVEPNDVTMLKSAIMNSLNKSWNKETLIKRAEEFSIEKQVESIGRDLL